MTETNYNKYFDYYIDLVNSSEPINALHETKEVFNALLETINDERGIYHYEDGKWSIKEVISHVIDAERVFAYRAMSFARNDKTNLAGFDDKYYAKNSGANKRSIAQLREEFDMLRNSSIALFHSFDENMWSREGEANNITIDVKSIAYLIAGHCHHHGNILKERYEV